jgi:hypothetical protein
MVFVTVCYCFTTCCMLVQVLELAFNHTDASDVDEMALNDPS